MTTPRPRTPTFITVVAAAIGLAAAACGGDQSADSDGVEVATDSIRSTVETASPRTTSDPSAEAASSGSGPPSSSSSIGPSNESSDQLGSSPTDVPTDVSTGGEGEASSTTSRPTIAEVASTTTSTVSTTAPTTTTATTAPTTASTAPAATATTPAETAGARVVPEQAHTQVAAVGGVVLVHPSTRVEMVGFHESNHDGARQLEVLGTAVNPMVLETRDRGTGSRTAMDVVVDPAAEIRAVVTGTVLRAGGYILYCDHNDDFLVIEPDSRPGWEVKMLHIKGVSVSAGDRVEAGVTVVAPAPTPLPFDSQVDEFTAEPSWPHVHVEVVDPSIPDRPSPGGGC